MKPKTYTLPNTLTHLGTTYRRIRGCIRVKPGDMFTALANAQTIRESNNPDVNGLVTCYAQYINKTPREIDNGCAFYRPTTGTPPAK
jgi:hypothetical protein